MNIDCALVHDPDVLWLDEPTAGVDPQSRNAIFDNLEAFKRAGKALVYTTHYMEEDIDGALAPALLRALSGVKSVRFDARRLTVGLDDLARGTQAVLQCVAAAGVSVRHLSSGRANLDDVFLALTGRQLRD